MIIRLLFVLRRRWPILLIIPLIGAGLGLLFTPSGQASTAAVYEASGSIAVDQQLANQTSIEQTLIESEQGAVGVAAAEAIGGGTTVAQVSSVIGTDFDQASFVITITARSEDPEIATQYARAFTTAFVAVSNGEVDNSASGRLLEATAARDDATAALDQFLVENEAALNGGQVPATVQIMLQRLQAEVASAQAALDALQGEPAVAEVYRVIAQGEARLVDNNKLELPASRLLRVTLGLLLGIVGAVVLVAVVEKINPRIDDPQHASDLIGAPVLAMVPVMPRRRRQGLARADPAEFRGPFAESFRSLRTHLDFRAQADGLDKPPRIMVTSATPSEGKSTCAAFMALSFAEVKRPPVVVGADLRRPSIHKIFEIDRLPGLSSRACAGGEAVPLSEIVKTDPVTGVSVVPSGPAVDRVTGLLQDLVAITNAGQGAGRVVIIDTPPVMVANDATDFLVAADWVVVVVRIGQSTERSVKQMMATLNLNEAKVVGIIMVGAVESSDAKRYYYSYYSLEGDEGSRRSPVKLPEPDLAAGPLKTTGSVDQLGD